MAGFQPVVMAVGQFEQVGDRRTEVLRLNIGPAVSIFVTTTTFTITRSCHRVFNNTGSNITVTDILGGTEGDVVFLFSGGSANRVKLQNSSANFDLDGDFDILNARNIVLYRTSTLWEEVTRTMK